MDHGTTRDFIEDLQQENARLHQAVANLCAEVVLLESDLRQIEQIVHRLKGQSADYVHREPF